MVGTNRFELLTSCLSSKRSNQLSYAPGASSSLPGHPREALNITFNTIEKQVLGTTKIFSETGTRSTADLRADHPTIC